MDSVEGKTAVITGGASGMGRAFADRFGRAGCRLVLADIEQPPLDAAVAELRAEGIEAIGVITDVSSESDMDELARTAFETFGTVNLVFNNAGVGGGGPMARLTTADWQWVLGVNVWGVVHGLRVFLAHLIEHGDGHIVNTGSVAGHTSYPGAAPYNASKHAVVTISETLYHELHEMNSTVGVSVLCPGLVSTNILSSHRNRPEQLRSPLIPPEPTEAEVTGSELIRDLFSHAKPPAAVADLVFDAVRQRQFYIFTDHVYDEAIRVRHDDIAQRRNPTYRGSLVGEDQSVG